MTRLLRLSAASEKKTVNRLDKTNAKYKTHKRGVQVFIRGASSRPNKSKTRKTLAPVRDCARTTV